MPREREAETAPPLPAELLGRVNRTLHERGVEGLFCTLAYALFDFQDRSVRVGNSGQALVEARAGSEAFLGGETPHDDVTLVVVKIL